MAAIAPTLEPRAPSFRMRLGVFVALFLAVATISIIVSAPQQTPWNWWLTIIWSAYLPIGIAGLVGAILSRRYQPSTFKGVVNNKVIFVIPTVARMDTLPALGRVVESVLKYAPGNFRNFRVDIIIDEGAEAECYLKDKFRCSAETRVVVVPKSFGTPNSARAKARANHYAMLVRRVDRECSGSWVYHLDDDTQVGHDTIASIAEAIAKNRGHHLFQGVLVYPFWLSKSWVCRLADSVRPPDDLTRFFLFTGVISTPLMGLHGEHLLIRASIEDELGWDTHSKVEDAYFALRFSEKYPGQSAFLKSCVYGASPSSTRDFVKQRRRWAQGLLELVFGSGVSLKARLPLGYAVVNWVLGFSQHVGVVLIIAYLLGFYNTSPFIDWVVFIWAFNMAYQLWMYVEGLWINAQVSGVDERLGRLAALALAPLILFFSLLEAFGALMGLLDFLMDNREFRVISKML